jgi:ribosomal protein S27AE
MNHYVYLIEKKNALPDSAKYYIGVRSCEGLIADDDYMGSSKYLTEDIGKQGKNNFNKIILKRFQTREEAVQYEIDMHNEFEVASNTLFFNKAKQTVVSFTPGVGENNYFYGKKHTEESRQKMREILKTKDCRNKRTVFPKLSDETKLLMSLRRKEWMSVNKHPMLGVKKTKQMKLNSSLGGLKQKRDTCKKCGLTTIAGNIARWHNEKCKN